MYRDKDHSGATPQMENNTFYIYNDFSITTMTDTLSLLGLKVTQCANLS